MNITKEKIDINTLMTQASHPQAGAVVLFTGVARNHHDNKAVDKLFYEAHENLADKEIQRILDTAKEKWSLQKALCIHRIGELQIGEVAVAIVTSSAHREECYEANRFIIDSIKESVPVFKKEFYSSENPQWK